MKIQVTVKSTYGTERIYPVCESAKLFASLIGSTTLPPRTIDLIKRLGFEVEDITPKYKFL